MPKEFNRTSRLAEVIQRELAVLIQQEIKDPRMKMITVSAVNLTRDLAHAKVYVTVLGNEEEIPVNIKLLNNAGKFLRSQLAHKLKIRTIPELTFIYDSSLVAGNKLAALIDLAIAKDKKNSKNNK